MLNKDLLFMNGPQNLTELSSRVQFSVVSIKHQLNHVILCVTFLYLIKLSMTSCLDQSYSGQRLTLESFTDGLLTFIKKLETLKRASFTYNKKEKLS